MRTPDRDEHVMQVSFVRMERRDSMPDTGRHHTQRIEYRNTQHSQRKGNQSITRTQGTSHIGPQHLANEDRHDNAHSQRTAITDEHARSPSKDVMEKERNQCTGRNRSQQHHRHIADTIEKHAENGTGHDAESR